MKKLYTHIVQIYNPKGKYWVKIDRVKAIILGHKKTPYKNIKKK